MPVPIVIIMAEECARGSADWLSARIRGKDNIFIFDCRTPNEFQRAHIRNSVNIHLPTILLKRLAKGSLSLSAVIPDLEIKQQFINCCKQIPVLLISPVDDQLIDSSPDAGFKDDFDDESPAGCSGNSSQEDLICSNCSENFRNRSSLASVLMRKLKDGGYDAISLQGMQYL